MKMRILGRVKRDFWGDFRRKKEDLGGKMGFFLGCDFRRRKRFGGENKNFSKENFGEKKGDFGVRKGEILRRKVGILVVEKGNF